MQSPVEIESDVRGTLCSFITRKVSLLGKMIF
jgi:hypothetical protein